MKNRNKYLLGGGIAALFGAAAMMSHKESPVPDADEIVEYLDGKDDAVDVFVTVNETTPETTPETTRSSMAGRKAYLPARNPLIMPRNLRKLWKSTFGKGWRRNLKEFAMRLGQLGAEGSDVSKLKGHIVKVVKTDAGAAYVWKTLGPVDKEGYGRAKMRSYITIRGPEEPAFLLDAYKKEITSGTEKIDQDYLDAVFESASEVWNAWDEAFERAEYNEGDDTFEVETPDKMIVLPHHAKSIILTL